jgi:dipeptidyl aminopeptidase/acylaminoacyl peptidase
VLFQNTLAMTNALQLAGKKLEFMLYPQKTHGHRVRRGNWQMTGISDRARSRRILKVLWPP